VRCSTTELERPALRVTPNTAAAIMAGIGQNLKSKGFEALSDRLAQCDWVF